MSDHERGTASTQAPAETASSTSATSEHATPGAAPGPARPSWWAGIVTILALLLMLLSMVSPVDAATPRTTLEEVEAELMCVTCKTPLNQSDARQADRERAMIERLIAGGATKQQAIDGMVAAYGDEVLIDPPESGLKIARIALPAGAALFGAGLLIVLVRRWRRSPDRGDGDVPASGTPDLESSSPDITDEDRRRLDAELERYA
ncbi:cytochrome c-type biogenesis protein [Patulibacter minatonensis]|uniref:cytochrome c-type biogenesis protein n=1 Tax=Patulibacter minatonensis TaxID=298163 RepID=UPI0004B017C0|nr:cytochrome c-type biogenesis protein CcmH [Patulibacter minatonensis]